MAEFSASSARFTLWREAAHPEKENAMSNTTALVSKKFLRRFTGISF
jgi:hypothetical protein